MKSRRTVLIVDDDDFIRQCLRDALPEDFGVVEAAQGALALEAFKKSSPDIVFLDLLMPEKSGIQVLRELRAASPRCPIIIISSLNVESLVAEAMQMGATAFLPKPFTPSDVLAHLKRVDVA